MGGWMDGCKAVLRIAYNNRKLAFDIQKFVFENDNLIYRASKEQHCLLNLGLVSRLFLNGLCPSPESRAPNVKSNSAEIA